MTEKRYLSFTLSLCPSLSHGPENIKFISEKINAFQDPFGDLIKRIMNVIHEHAKLHPTCEPGSQLYEQWVIQRNRKGERTISLSLSIVTEKC